MITEPIRPAVDHYRDFPAVRDWADFEGREAAAFTRANPVWELYRSDANAALLLGWCSALAIPVTRWNLAIGFHELVAQGTLKPVPGEPAPERAANRGIKLCRGDVMLEYVPGAEEAEQLSRLRDDPSLPDNARKKRFAALKELAAQQRRSLRVNSR